MRLMLDTSAYVAFKRGHVEALEAIRQSTEIFVPTVVLGELLSGFALGSRQQKNREELEELLHGSRVTVAVIRRITAECYAKIYVSLRSAGRPIPTNDLWIAASAMEHRALLLTADNHFLIVPQIKARRISITP